MIFQQGTQYAGIAALGGAMYTPSFIRFLRLDCRIDYFHTASFAA